MTDIDEAVRWYQGLRRSQMPHQFESYERLELHGFCCHCTNTAEHPLHSDDMRRFGLALLGLDVRCEKLTAVYEAAVAWRHTSITLQNPIEDSEIRRAAHRLANIDLCEAIDAARGAGTDGGKRP